MDNMPDLPPEFWRAVSIGATAGAAVVVRILLYPAKTIRQSFGGAGAGMLCAFLLTEPVAQTLGLAEYENVVAASIALIGEQIVRKYMEAAESPKFFRAILRRLGFRVDDDDKGGRGEPG